MSGRTHNPGKERNGSLTDNRQRFADSFSSEDEAWRGDARDR